MVGMRARVLSGLRRQQSGLFSDIVVRDTSQKEKGARGAVKTLRWTFGSAMFIHSLVWYVWEVGDQ